MKVLCSNPDHADSTPSMELYPEGGFCFVCGWVDKHAVGTAQPRVKEDLQATLEYITTLKTGTIRGLPLKYDSTGYYLVWPDQSFYKKRLFKGKSRYLAPRGYTQPVLHYPAGTNHIVVVEGELNAMSLHYSCPELDVCSPGSANKLHVCSTIVLTSSVNCTIVVDKDAAGVSNAVPLAHELLAKGKRVQIAAVEEDINDILQRSGVEGVKAWAKSQGLS